MKFLVYDDLSARSSIPEHKIKYNAYMYVCIYAWLKPLAFNDMTAVQSERAICPACQRLTSSVLALSKDQMGSNQALVTGGNGSVNHMLTPQGPLAGSFSLSDQSWGEWLQR